MTYMQMTFDSPPPQPSHHDGFVIECRCMPGLSWLFNKLRLFLVSDIWRTFYRQQSSFIWINSLTFHQIQWLMANRWLVQFCSGGNRNEMGWGTLPSCMVHQWLSWNASDLLTASPVPLTLSIRRLPGSGLLRDLHSLLLGKWWFVARWPRWELFSWLGGWLRPEKSLQLSQSVQSPSCVCSPNRSREHPDLQLWCQPWKQHSGDGRSHSRHIHVTEAKNKEEAPTYRTLNGVVEKPLPLPLPLPRSVEESYITSEHCYQKPRTYYPAVEQKLVVETRGSALDDAVNTLHENGDDSLSPRLGWPLDQGRSRGDSDPKTNSPKVCSSLYLFLIQCLSDFKFFSWS